MRMSTAPAPIRRTKTIDVSYATGRLLFGSDAFGDNPTGHTPVAHRVRIFYAGDAGWTVAVQKAPAMYTRLADVSGATDPMTRPRPVSPLTLSAKWSSFPRCDAGKTVEFDGISATPSAAAARRATPPSPLQLTRRYTRSAARTMFG